MTTELDREHSEPPWVGCDKCGGRGWITGYVDIGGGNVDMDQFACTNCNGTGLLCAECGEPWDTEHECAPWYECECDDFGCPDYELCVGKACRKCDQPWSEDHECAERRNK